MKNWRVIAMGAAGSLAATGVMAQGRSAMDGAMWGNGWLGGIGGMWLPTLLVVATVGLFAWLVRPHDS